MKSVLMLAMYGLIYIRHPPSLPIAPSLRGRFEGSDGVPNVFSMSTDFMSGVSFPNPP